MSNGDIFDFADSIVKHTEPETPRDLSAFIEKAADYKEPMRLKMKRFAVRDLKSREGKFFTSPFMRTAAVKVGATGGGLIARVTGNKEAADRAHRLSAAYTHAQQEQLAGQTFPGLPDVAARGAVGIGTEITAQAPFIAGAAMTGLGAPAIIGQAALTTADRSYTEARDAGKGEREAAQHAIGMGAIEGGVTAAFQMFGIGGFEKFFGRAASKPMQAGVRAAAKRLGIETTAELTEELMVNFGQSVLGWADGVDPEAMTWERWKQSTKDIFLQTVATMGLYATPGILAGRDASRIKSTQDKILELADKEKVTRKDWSNLGFSRFTGETEVERGDTIKFMAEQIRSQLESGEPVAPDMQGAVDSLREGVQAEETVVEPEVIQKDGAVTAEQEAGDTTGIHDKIADRIRRGVGLPGLEGESQQSLVRWNESAKSKMDADPNWVTAIVEDLKDNPRNLEPVETAGLNRHMRELDNELKVLSSNIESVDEAEAADAMKKSENVINAIDELTQVSKRAGTLAGRSLAARKIELEEDYSVASIKTKERVLKRQPLSREEHVEISALANEITTLQDKLAKEKADHQAALDASGVERAVSSVKRRKPSRKAAARTRRRIATETFRDATRNLELFGAGSVKDFLKGESGAVRVPVEVIEAGIEVVKAYVNEGVATFSEFWAEARVEVDNFPQAEEAFRQSWEKVQESGGVEQMVIRSDDTNAIGNYANRMLRAVVDGGKVDSDAVTEAVHVELSKVVPGITRRQVLDAITRQGRYATKPKEKSEAQENIAEVRKQLVLQNRLNTLVRGEVPGQKLRQKAEVSDEISSLRKQIAAAEEASPAVRRSKDEKVKESYTKQLRNRLDEYQRQLEEDDVAPKKLGKTPESKRISDLQYEIDVAKGKVRARRERLRIQNMNKGERAWHALKNVLHTQRTVMLSLDSPLLRQGAFFAYGHPAKAARSLLGSFKAWGSKKGAAEIDRDIESRDNYRTYIEMGIDFTELGGEFGRKEEDFAEGYINELRSIPGVGVVAAPVVASGRGHTSLLNIIRADHADALIESFGGADALTDAHKKLIGNFVNVSTGRGNLGSLEKHAEVFALAFLAPRYVASRFQLGLVEPAKIILGTGGHDAKSRAIFAKEYARSLAGAAIFSSMVGMALNFMSDDEDAGAPERDPRSSGFMKTQVGNTLLDLTGGVSQTSVLLARVISGQYKSRKGEIKPLRDPVIGEGEGPKYGEYDMNDVLNNFKRYKFAPWLSFSWDLATGETAGGFEKATATNLAKNYLVPIPIIDVLEATKELGIPRGLAVSLIMEAGSGMQTYDVQTKQKGVIPNPFAVTDSTE